MKKKEFTIESENVFKESQVIAILERMEGKIDLTLEGHIALREEVREFKVETKNNFSAVFEYLSKIDDEAQEFKAETKNNFSAVFEYLSRIDDELINIREELEKKKEEIIDKNWLKKIEQRLAEAEKELRRQKLAVK